MMQTDEADLMPYKILVSIERMAILERKAPTAIYQQLAPSNDSLLLKGWIRRYFTRWAANQWKRERMAPSFHFDDFNVDPRSWYRFPILSGGFTNELNEMDKMS